jgi:SAM-dependent methyltransferase
MRVTQIAKASSLTVKFHVGTRASFCSSTEQPEINDYDEIAPVFDAVMGFDFHQATHYLREAAINKKKWASGPFRCLDLCCGTGLFFHKLAHRFSFDGLGLDCSKKQIEFAVQRTAKLGARYSVVDVASATFPEHLDLVTINFDALNHLRAPSMWLRVFQRIYRALNKNGLLIFDINLPERLCEDWDAPEVIVKDDLTYVQLAYPWKRVDGGVVRCTPMIVYQRTHAGTFQRLGALIEQFALPLQTVVEMLRASGFTEIALLQDATEVPVGHIFNKHRVIISATKQA